MSDNRHTCDRGVSTVLDVTLCLLLLSTAIGLLVYAPDRSPSENHAADAATVLGTSTEAMTYAAGPPEQTYNRSRTDHGTVARVLASAAIAEATLDGQQLTPDQEYTREATGAATNIVASVDGRTALHAQWRPVAGGAIAGHVTVGPTPPPTADVHAARIAVPVGEPSHIDQHSNVSYTVAKATIDVLCPPSRMETALSSPGEDAQIVRERYRSLGATLGVDPAPAIRAETATKANTYLARALASRLEQRYNRTTLSKSQPTTVRITVQTWE